MTSMPNGPNAASVGPKKENYEQAIESPTSSSHLAEEAAILGLGNKHIAIKNTQQIDLSTAHNLDVPSLNKPMHNAKFTEQLLAEESSEGQEPSNTQAHKPLDSLTGAAGTSRAAEYSDQEKDCGATSNRQTPPKSRCVLVAKCLTNSDAHSGRIILPRVAVEANLPFVTSYRHYALKVRDNIGRKYEFVIKSWANGTEHRRVFVLEQAGEFLRRHHIGVGDAVGICTDENGDLIVESNTEEVKQALVCPRYGGAATLAAPHGVGSGTATASGASAVPLAAVMAGRCARSVHCTKPAGHPGFCSGPKAAAAAAAAAAQAHAAGAAAAARYRRKLSNTTSSALDSTTYTTTATTTIDDLSSYPEDDPDAPFPAGLHTIAYIPAGLRLCKELTSYDLSSKRIILPSAEIEDGIPNCCDEDLFTLAGVDESQIWHFPTLRAWNTVSDRRGYLLEGVNEFLTSRGAEIGDKLIIYRENNLMPPRIELHSKSLIIRRPENETTGLTFAQLPVLLHPQQAKPQQQQVLKVKSLHHHQSSERSSFEQQQPEQQQHVSSGMSCQRTCGCTKAAGHQGFCSGHKGFKRREGTPTAAFAAGVRNPLRNFRGGSRSSSQYRYTDEEDYNSWGSEDDEYTPSFKRQKSSSGSGASTPRKGDPLLSLLELLDG